MSTYDRALQQKGGDNATKVATHLGQLLWAQQESALLNNAAKYTPEGGDIWLEVRGEGDKAVIAVRDMRIFAMTGYGQEEDRRRSLASGFDGHLVKPVLPSDLLGILEEPEAP